MTLVAFIKNSTLPVVVKADGLAAGKGVTICKSKKQVVNVTSEIFKGKFKSSKKVVLEEFLKGDEASYFLVVDKNSFKFLLFEIFFNKRNQIFYRSRIMRDIQNKIINNVTSSL